MKYSRPEGAPEIFGLFALVTGGRFWVTKVFVILNRFRWLNHFWVEQSPLGTVPIF